jgi:hypothetical protein
MCLPYSYSTWSFISEDFIFVQQNIADIENSGAGWRLPREVRTVMKNQVVMAGCFNPSSAIFFARSLQPECLLLQLVHCHDVWAQSFH